MFNEKFKLKKENFVVILLGCIVLLILWMSNRRENTQTSFHLLPKLLLEKISQPNINTSAKQRVSIGNRILITADSTPDKQVGVKAFAAGDYARAAAKFSSSLQLYPNDPETLIYMNNAVAASKGSKMKVGVSVPIGGNLNVAKEILRGVAQAQNEINQSGGIKGKLIKIEIANDDNDPEVAKEVATNFVNDKRILAVIGHNSSNASLAAAPIYQEASLVMISPTSTARELAVLGNHVFRTTPNTRVIADTIANYIVKSANKTSIALCVDSQSGASKSFRQEFTIALFEHGGEVAATLCDFSSPNFNAAKIPSQAISDGADALLLIPSVNRMNQAIGVARANRHRLALISNHSMYTYATLKEGQQYVNGMVLPVVWHPGSNTNPSFITNTKSLWGTVGSWRTATAYDAAQVIIAGLKVEVSRDQLQKSLASPGFSARGATGNIKFVSSGDRQGTAELVKIQPGNRSGTGYDFVALEVDEREINSDNSEAQERVNNSSI